MPWTPELLLQNGTYYGLKRISRSGSLDLSIKWEAENSELNFDDCLTDVKQVAAATRELKASGNVGAFSLQRMAQLTVAAVRTPETAAAGSSESRISFQIHLNQPEALNALNRQFAAAAAAAAPAAAAAAAPTCPQQNVRSSLLALKPQETAFVATWFSIPREKSYALYPRDFRVRVFCHSAADCNLSQFSFCFRLACPIKSAAAEAAAAAAEEAMQHPVGPRPAPAAAAAQQQRAAPLLQQQQQQLLQQQQQKLKQLQFRGRYGFIPYWAAAAYTPQTNWAVTAAAAAAAAAAFFLF
ncbi:hypothetical protein, conserved [Eimeria tenella]|uniref:Uncharacterized protein n=1 Tax=Eimeria tenella TaxID=5802 RepID=U6KX02_EIMTE|nr:hypothetical protein, conserved [Eimeria tenella]CDJ40025.1 hypothetical protein, conserved [Eimeria tenella]|eukprot:XP_013230778.1 hypothetical protein, conserved [Eimeria tenella]